MGRFRRSSLGMISTTTLRAWLNVADRAPDFLPLVPDMRIAVRNELWKRERDEDAVADGWLLSTLPGLH